MSKKKGFTQLEISINPKYNQRERKAIAQDVIDFMIDRTLKGKKSGGGSFPSYSKAYMKSDEFKRSGKGRKVNLKLSFDMLSSMELVKEESGKITVGYKKGNAEEGKAEGNIRGTYGKSSPIAGKARDFLQMNKTEEKKITGLYPLRGKDGVIAAALREERLQKLEAIDQEADSLVERLDLWSESVGFKDTD
jgi:hypothetical protein